ncbi:hypothetical protein FSP39_009299 [Pinctada imbricata]|uniref:TOG domain-containing protein n=1 Tax=Pinctada imbricata TaxID=66713 RepID=A0AA89C737_PINIB|nr:hypothetical protein FSP39_009299 [Pinctada imbricata]
MGDDTEWQKLPTDEKCQHKVWKARLAGYEEAYKLFNQITDEKSPEFNKYAGVIKKFVIDNNAVAQEKALDAVQAFVENAAVAGRVCQDVVNGVITKCLNASKQKTKDKGIEIVMVYIEIEKQDIVQECLLAGLDNKQPKIVVGCIQTMRLALRDFGNKIMPIKPCVPKLPKLLEDRDKNIREETKLFIIEIYRWIKQAIKPQMTNFKPVQVAELEAEFEKIGNEKPQQARFLRSQQDLKAKMEEKAAGGGEVDDEGEEEAEEVDPYELMTAVDILPLLPKDFFDKIEAKKWQERKEALEALQKLSESPKIEGGDHGQLVRSLIKVIGKDTNVLLVALAGKCMAGLARGLRKKFSPYSVNVIQCILEKFKEKKPTVVQALREAIDEAYFATTLEAIVEDIVAALDNKNPQIKAETSQFLSRCFAKSTMATLPKKLLKTFCTSLLKTVNDTAPDVREGSFAALGMAMKVVSEKHIMPFLVDVDSIKMQKIQECCQNAVLLNAKGEPRSGGGGGAAAKPPPAKDSAPKPVQRPATAKSGGPPRLAPAKKKAPAKGKGKGATKNDKGEITEAVLSDEAVAEKAEVLFTGEVLKQLENANWKERLAGMERVTEVIKGMSREEIKCQVVVRTVCKKPGLKDNNFQVLKIKVDLVAHLAKNSVFTRVSAESCLSDLVDKVGDVKNGAAVQEALSCIAEAVSLEYVGSEVINLAFEQKNPKNQSEALNWLSTALKEFGFKVNAKQMIETLKKAFAATNPAVRTSAITLIGVMYMFMGQNLRMMFEGEKPALLQQIDAEIEKVKGEKPPAPVRGLKSGGGGKDDDEDEDEADDGGEEPAMEDLVPRNDIGDKITEELINSMADKNWKIRKEGLEKVVAILNEAKFITGKLGGLPEAIKVRLGDTNKILAGMAIGICSTLGTNLGPHCKQHIKTIGPALILCMGDSKVGGNCKQHIKTIGPALILCMGDSKVGGNCKQHIKTIGPALILCMGDSKVGGNCKQHIKTIGPALILCMGDSKVGGNCKQHIKTIGPALILCMGDSKVGGNCKQHIKTIGPALILCMGDSKVGGNCKQHIKTIGPALILCMGDSKPQLRAAAVGALNIWVDNCSLLPLVEAEALSDSLKLENPNLRQELLGWLVERLPNHKQLPTEFKMCIPHLLSCLEDRNGEVRKKAQDALVPFMIHVGYESVFKATSKLKPASKDQIMAIIEKAKANIPAKPAKVKKGGGSKAPPKEEVEEEAAPVKPPSRPLSTASSEGGGESKPATKTVKSKGKAAPPPSSKNKKKEEETGPPMTLTVPKERRFKEEKSLKVLKWNFIQLTPEFTEQLTLQMEKNFSKSMMDMMYHKDFKFHTKAIEQLLQCMDSLKDETIGNLDLILKWFTIRFLDTNPSMLNKALEYLHKVFTMLAEMDYNLHEIEASSFIPYLILKVGDPKDNVRQGVRGIIKVMYKIYPASKIFVFLMDGVKSKNAKQRMECLEELGYLIESYGISICQPSPGAAMKVIAGNIGDRDNSVRNAALNTAVQAYLLVGEQQFYKLTGSLSDKDLSLLEERIKRSAKNKPPPKVEERPKTAPGPVQKSVKNNPASSGLQRPSTALPKSSSNVRREYQLDPVESEEAPVEIPKLYQYEEDIEEILQPVEKPKISYRSQDPAQRRMNAGDASDAILRVVHQISGSDILLAQQALSQIDELLKDEERAEMLSSHMDQLLLCMTMQFKMIFMTHMNNEELDKKDIIRLHKYLLSTLLALFQNRALAGKPSKDSLKDLVSNLLTLLLDSRLNNMEEGPQVIRLLNVMVIKIIENSDHTNILCAFIRLLHDSIASATCAANFLELILKCIWKMVKLLPEIINDISMDQVLLECHTFLQAFPSNTWARRPSDTPLRTIKTVLHTLAKAKGAKVVLNQMHLIDSSENSEVKAFLQKCLLKSRSESTSVGESESDTPRANNQRPKKIAKSSHDVLAEIFKKIGSKENAREGLSNLYDFKKKNPDADLEPFLKKTSQYFQNFVERGLKQIELEREGKISVPEPTTIYRSGDNSTKTQSVQGDAPVDANYYMERLKKLRAKCGLESTEKSDKAEKVISTTEEEKREDDIQVNITSMEPESTDKPAIETSGLPTSTSTTDMSELKMRLERIKKLAKS